MNTITEEMANLTEKQIEELTLAQAGVKEARRWIAYYIKNKRTNPNDRNDWAIFVMIDQKSWPDRIRRHRGCRPEDLAFRRNMQPHEIEIAESHYRITSYKYYTKLSLIEDEISILGEGHPFIPILKKELQSYEYIP